MSCVEVVNEGESVLKRPLVDIMGLGHGRQARVLFGEFPKVDCRVQCVGGAWKTVEPASLGERTEGVGVVGSDLPLIKSAKARLELRIEVDVLFFWRAWWRAFRTVDLPVWARCCRVRSAQ